MLQCAQSFLGSKHICPGVPFISAPFVTLLRYESLGSGFIDLFSSPCGLSWTSALDQEAASRAETTCTSMGISDGAFWRWQNNVHEKFQQCSPQALKRVFIAPSCFQDVIQKPNPEGSSVIIDVEIVLAERSMCYCSVASKL